MQQTIICPICGDKVDFYPGLITKHYGTIAALEVYVMDLHYNYIKIIADKYHNGLTDILTKAEWVRASKHWYL